MDILTLNYELHMRIYRASRTVHLVPLIERIWASFEWASTVIPSAIQIRITPIGNGGQWQVDDLYIDPFARH